MNHVDQVEKEIAFLVGMAESARTEQARYMFESTIKHLQYLSRKICAGGYLSCGGGRNCQSDHK